MAVVTFTLAIDEYVIIEIITGGTVKPNSTACGFGIVRVIGPTVTQVSVGFNVFFKNGVSYSVGGDVFFVVDQKDIMFIKTVPP